MECILFAMTARSWRKESNLQESVVRRIKGLRGSGGTTVNKNWMLVRFVTR